MLEGGSGLIFELMSNGTTAQLPQAPLPEGIPEPGGPFVLLLLPYNRYLLGCSPKGGLERWIWGRPGGEPEELFLYEDRELVLTSKEATLAVLSPEIVERLRSALLSQAEPPGDHLSAVLILRGLMREHAAFSDGVPFRSEGAFVRLMEEDESLRKCYWALRFALARGEFDAVVRLRAWLKAGPQNFSAQETPARIWFSILDLPCEKDLSELESLSFSREDLQHMVSQDTVPLLLFNPRSGYLILSRFGSRERAAFQLWVYLSAALWGELRERRKLSMRELLLAVWGDFEVAQAQLQRARYMPSPGNTVSVV